MSTERPGVYLIEHRASGRVYVGSASNLSKRWSRHRKDLEAGRHRNAHLQAAWNRYGAEAFTWQIAAIVEPGERIAVEQGFIDHFDAASPDRGFNKERVAGVTRGTAGCKLSPERVAQMAATNSRAWEGKRVKAGDTCPAGHIIDGTQIHRKRRPNGHVTLTVRCQECTRLDSLRRARERAGIPPDWPAYKRFNRREVVPHGKPGR